MMRRHFRPEKINGPLRQAEVELMQVKRVGPGWTYDFVADRTVDWEASKDAHE
jgi:hypothetical protein